MKSTELRLRELSGLLKTRQVSAMEVLNDYLETALKGSCITFCSELAFETSKNIDEGRFLKGSRAPLEGLPFSLKDNISTKGIQTTCNSRILKSHVPDYNAFITERLIDLGAVITAKNCMREFSVGKIEDSAFELRSYIDWAGTNKNVNIGAFSVGTDIGMSEFYCGLWTIKPSSTEAFSKGIISGSPTLEKITVSARRADDLDFIYPLIADETIPESGGILPKKYKILVYDNLNMPDYIVSFLEYCGFSIHRSDCRFIDKAELIYDCLLCTEFFLELYDIGKPNPDVVREMFFESELVRNRTDGMGLEVKRLILTGAHLLSSKNLDRTMKILDARTGLTEEFKVLLSEYDLIAAPAIYGDKLSKASAAAELPELVVPFGDVLPFKLVAAPGSERLLLDMALFFEKML